LLRALLLDKFADSAHSEEWKQTLKEHDQKKDRVIEKYKGICEEKKVERTFILSKISFLSSLSDQKLESVRIHTSWLAVFYNPGIAYTAAKRR